MNIYQNRGFSKEYSDDIALGQRVVCFSVRDMSAKDKVKVPQSHLTLWPHGLYSPWNSPGQNTGVGSCFPPPGNLPNPRIEPRSPTFQVDSLSTKPPGKPIPYAFWRHNPRYENRHCTSINKGFPGGVVVKNPPANAGGVRDVNSIPGLERSPGGGNGNPLQYSYLENPMDRGVWQAMVHRIAKSQIRLSD